MEPFKWYLFQIPVKVPETQNIRKLVQLLTPEQGTYKMHSVVNSRTVWASWRTVIRHI